MLGILLAQKIIRPIKGTIALFPFKFQNLDGPLRKFDYTKKPLHTSQSKTNDTVPTILTLSLKHAKLPGQIAELLKPMCKVIVPFIS